MQLYLQYLISFHNLIDVRLKHPAGLPHKMKSRYPEQRHTIELYSATKHERPQSSDTGSVGENLTHQVSPWNTLPKI